MYHLIKKDILIQKRALKLSFLLIIFFSITLSNIGSVGLTIGILAVTYQLVLGASALEDKNNSDIILISLPIRRSSIVLAKYLSPYVYATYAILGFYLVHLMIDLLNIPVEIQFNVSVITGGFIALTLFCSISFPLIFKYGYVKAKMANLLIFFAFVFGGTGLGNYLVDNKDLFLNKDMIHFFNNGSTFLIVVIMVIPLAIILVCSYFISQNFYRKREF